MKLRLALVLEVQAMGCTIRWLDQQATSSAGYSAAMQDRVRLCARQLVAVDTASSPPTVMWRWFRGRIVYREEDYVVVNNRIYQPHARAPISVLRLPDELEVDVRVGDEVFYSLDVEGVAIDTVQDDAPAHPARIAADLFPAIMDVYAEYREQGRF